MAGLAVLSKRYASRGAALGGWSLLVLTAVLFVPQFPLAQNTDQFEAAINFVSDTLLFSGTMLVVNRAILETARTAIRHLMAQTTKCRSQSSKLSPGAPVGCAPKAYETNS